MITNFDEETAPLTDEEKRLVEPICKGLLNHVGKCNAITNGAICKAINEKMPEDLREAGFKLTDARLRKIINHIRNNDLVGCLCAGAVGYYVGDIAETQIYITSLEDRVREIATIKNALRRQLANRINLVHQQKLEL